jgi:hypothetical protein
MNRMMRAVAVLFGRDEHRAAGAPSLATATSTSVPPDGTTPLAMALVACLDLLDPDEEAAERAITALAEAGVVAIGSDGERFDRQRHRAEGRVDTDDPARDWIVANTVRTGWACGERILRPAQVWVYRHTAGGSGRG